MDIHSNVSSIIMCGCVCEFVIVCSPNPQAPSIVTFSPFTIIPRHLGICVLNTLCVCGSTYSKCLLLTLVVCVLGFTWAHVLEYVIDVIITLF